jgi:prepilin-type processing-associated H-X9-DG protein
MIVPRSRHTDGVNTALCDGSVRFVSQTISLDASRAMSTARGNETVSNQ